MAKFTLVNDAAAVSTARMFLDGERDTKRLRLHDVGAKKEVLQVTSTNPKMVAVTLFTLFDGPKGIWTVDIVAKAKGKADVEAKLKGASVAKVAVTIVDSLIFPAIGTEAGMLVRLFLSETTGPGQTGFKAADARKGMQWMRVVLVNRLKNNPGQFGAPGAKTILDVVKAKGQFAGFEKYPTLDAKVSTRISDVVKIANNDNDERQEKFLLFLQDALDVAKENLIADPCKTGLYGWRPVGKPDPAFEPFSAPLGGNQFTTLKSKK